MTGLPKERANPKPDVELSLDSLDLQHYFSRLRADNGHANSKAKRTFEELRLRILICLAGGNRTINDIAVRTGINWRTVELHLTHLLGRKMVEEIFSSQYVRIFTITPRGRESLVTTKQRILAVLTVEPDPNSADAEVRR